MLAFVDESGCTGTKERGAGALGGSSTIFVVAAVLFPDRAVASECVTSISALCSELKPKKKGELEFGFSSCSDSVRERFFTTVCCYPFQYFGIAINKSLLAAGGPLPFAMPFQECAIEIFKQAAPNLESAIVKIDNSGGKKTRREMQQELKRVVNASCGREAIKKVKHEASHTNELLQLADMVCGASARSFSGATDAGRFRDQISHKEAFFRVLP